MNRTVAGKMRAALKTVKDSPSAVLSTYHGGQIPEADSTNTGSTTDSTFLESTEALSELVTVTEREAENELSCLSSESHTNKYKRSPAGAYASGIIVTTKVVCEVDAVAENGFADIDSNGFGLNSIP